MNASTDIDKFAAEVPMITGNNKDLSQTIDSISADIKQHLSTRGALLLRGFATPNETTAETALSTVSHELLDDAYWSTPRSNVANKTFTATNYDKTRTILLHSEMAYMTSWPRFVCFHSIKTAAQGGQTTLCDIDKVSKELGKLLIPFQEKGILYRRTYHTGIDIPWQTAFQTEDKDAVQEVADRVGMQTTWLEGDSLQTEHIAQGCANDGDQLLWFSQAHLFHTSNIPEQTLTALEQLFGYDQLPRNALFGDGSKIPTETILKVKSVFDQYTIKTPWQDGDVLLLDNMRFTHGRLPYEGERKLHVALAGLHSKPERTPLFS